MSGRRTLSEFAARAIRVPFAEHGRDWTGWDCWGLVRMAYAEVFGIDLPSFADRYETTADRDALAEVIAAERTPWRPVSPARPGDVVLLKILGRPSHIGLLLEGRSFLHAESKVGANVEDLDDPLWAGKVEGFYRHELLA